MKYLNKKNYFALFIIALLFFLLSNNLPVSSQNEAVVNAEIKLLNEQINRQKKYLDSLNERKKQYETLVEKQQLEVADLSNQINIIENSISQSELEIEIAEAEISALNLEIEKVRVDSLAIDRKINEQKDNISKLLRLSYKQSQVSTLEILLLNDSLADFLNQIKYLDNTNKEISNKVNQLRLDKEKLQENQKILLLQEEELNKLKTRLISQKNRLEYEQETKLYLLEDTKSLENEYQQLVAQAKKEQQQANAEISNLEVAVRQKLASLQGNRLEESDSTIAWPVTKNVITATFRDPRYPYRRLIGEHSGVDIRAAQGSTLRAAADGYVARVKFDGSTAYSYIMIVHNDGLSTVYGHISATSVSADDYVVQGQVIGKTGGAPGSIGAGAFSTGPHLHFEVRLNGLPVDPLNYLP
jgi:murein DD-endopeptidase MepM/ murein hydrolase activator NlpD